MDILNAMMTHLACLPGAVGIEGVNPTCVEWGFPTSGYLQTFAALPWIAGIAGVLFGLPMAAWFVSIVLSKFGPGLIGRR
jgi:hypothetical protein